ncbi:MAG: signal peptide peptidase SppA [candidate division WS1 bacterium]|jgi:protease-4|nr:signal peptide peptidase SppA [candidate division WS1 bacterium]
MGYDQTGGPQHWTGGQAGYASPPPPPPPPQQPPRRGTNWLLVVGGLIAAMVLLGGMVLVIAAVMGLAGSGSGFENVSGDSVAVVTVEGVISTSGEQTLFGDIVGGARATMEQLREAAEDESVRAVVLRINSPGGSPAASQEIYTEVMRLAKEKPVVVSMADVAASGGYYIAAPAHRIVADPSTVTGSIGVRMEVLQYTGLMEKLGIEARNMTSGPYKDTGSPLREMREDERQLLQSIIDDMYRQFVRDVSVARKMKLERVRELADGRVYTGEEAVRVGLVDELGNFYRAVEIAAGMGGIEGEPDLREMNGTGGLFDWFGLMTKLSGRSAIDYLLYDHRLDNVRTMMQMRDLAVPTQ